MTELDVRVLGPLEVVRDGEVVRLGGRKQRSVLAALVLRRGEVLSADRLADAIWGGEPPASVSTTLRGYVSNLRKALEADPSQPRLLRTTQAGYVLDLDGEAIDACRFERLVVEARDLDGAAAVDVWTQALALWRGDPYQDFAYEEFVQAEIHRLTELRLACMEDLFEAQLDLGRHAATVADLDVFCADHPGRERALRLRMLALYRCGRQTEALQAYEDGRRRLAEELGVDPSSELRELHERIVRQDPDVAAQPTAGKQTLTFLLGDVERSTSKLRSLGDDYADALDDHRRILRESFAAHDGRAVRVGGDEVFAVFDGATRAVRAAITAQLALCRSDVPDDRRLPVRMGLHTGEAMFTGGDYVGMPIHVAARIMDAAHGGQILVSQATKELVADDEVSFTDAGAHVLKDIADAVRIHQVVHPDLRTEFPALRTVSTRTNNLPQRPTSFVGRDADVAQVEALLDEARVVTLSGVGGVGKTRLAVEVASRVATSYEDGVWLCELAPLVDAEAIVPAITSTLGIQPQPGKTVRESLLAALAQRESLVILDNCEHVLEPVARLVEDIVHGSAKVTVLATSRETIGVDGERSMRVRSLDEASVQLFGDRARSVRPDFEVDATNEDAVREVCAKLDGIPLAIELAAVRVTSMTPAQIAERLERDLRFLRSGRRAAVDRHRTLHAAIDSSYDALSEVEKLLFERLSVFAGGFDLDGAEEVCGRDLDVDVADGLASLVAKSMVDCDVTGERARFTLLETMRQYGQDCLTDRGQAEDTLRAHAEYVARSVELERDRFVFEAHFDPRRARAAFDNVRAAWAWARSAGEIDLLFRIISGSFFALEVGFEEVWHWSEEALAMPELEDHPLRSEVLAAVAHGAQRAADLVRSRRLCLEAIDRLDDPDDPRQVFPLNQLFVVLQNEGELDEARRCNQELVRIAKLHGVVLMESWAPMLGSLIESASGEFDAAVAMAEEGLRRAKGTSMEALGLYFLGDALQQAGDDERALECLEESLRRCREMDWRFFVTINLTVLAQVRARHGDPHEALRMFREVIDHWRRAGVWIRQWVALLNLIEVFGRLEMDEAAIVLLAAAESSSSAAPAVGPQGERLEALRREVTEHIGDDAVAAATARGRAMSDEDAVAFAKAEIDRVLALDGAQA